LLLLDRSKSHAGSPGWTPEEILKSDPGLAAGIGALLGALELHGLIEQPPLDIPLPQDQSGEIIYDITPAGREFLSRLAEEPDA
jgi:hypothetical protein